jgi:hypothetical protein
MNLLPDNAADWARKIAMEIDPAYEPLAPMYLEAYVRGGRERQQLFEQVAVVGGVVGEGGISLLPYAFAALSGIAAQLGKLCGGGGLSLLSDLLACWKNWLELIQLKASTDTTRKSEDESGDLAALRRVLATVQGSLEQQGLAPEQSELITYRVMKVLLQAPAEAAQLLSKFPAGEK